MNAKIVSSMQMHSNNAKEVHTTRRVKGKYTHYLKYQHENALPCHPNTTEIV